MLNIYDYNGLLHLYSITLYQQHNVTDSYFFFCCIQQLVGSQFGLDFWFKSSLSLFSGIMIFKIDQE